MNDENRHAPMDSLGLGLTQQFEKMLRQTCMDIFSSYRTVLVNESIDYTVDAVWGSTRRGELSSTQSEIFSKVKPAIAQMQLALEADQLNREQTFVQAYMIRGLVIMKILYMIELVRKNLLMQEAESQPRDHSLQWIEPLGRA